MMDLDALTDLYRHMEWADAAVWSAVIGCAAAQDDSTLRGLLQHIHVVQHAFLSAWQTRPLDATGPASETLPPVLAWGRAYHRDLHHHLPTVDPVALSRPWNPPWVELVAKGIGRTPMTSTLGDTMLQVTLHSHYHRGQVNLRLRELGGIPPLVDYIAWVWFGRPVPEWPALNIAD
jgi:uncharacterized damage-inducible protein DinB